MEAELSAIYIKEKARLLTLEYSGIFDSPVFGEGSPESSLMLVGEAPGADEVKLGRPFVGKAGRQLDGLLCLAGIAREDIYITNAVKYRPVTKTRTGMKNRTPTAKEVKDSLHLLRAEIELLRPALIVTLGNTPLKAVAALFNINPGTIGDAHGQAIKINNMKLYPMYHPASVIYNRSLIKTCEDDAKGLGFLVNNR